MLPRERVQAAFEHRPSDRVPIYQAGFSSYAASLVLGREAYTGGGIQQFREARALWNGRDAHAEFLERARADAFDLAEILDLDLIRPSYWRLPERPTRKIDEFTYLYGSEAAGNWHVMTFDPTTELYQVTARAARPEPTLEDLESSLPAEPPDPDAYRPTPSDYPDLVAAVGRFGRHRAIPGSGTGLCIPRDPIWLEATVLRPDLVGRYLDCQVAHVPGSVAAMAEIGVTYLCGGGDFAGPRGPMYSPRVFHDLMAPRLQRISRACHSKGCYHGFASDGNLWSVADDLFGTSGVDFYYEVDRRSGMDLRQTRKAFPRLTLWGGISSETLHLGSEADVRGETLTALDAAKEFGGIVVGCSNQIVIGTPPRNLEVMLETLREHR